MQQKQHKQQQLNSGINDPSHNCFPTSKGEFKKQATANKKISKKLVATAIVEVCILMMMSFAWYYYQAHRKALSEERDVMAPYYLYLVDETGEDSFSLTVGDLHPGEVKQIILGVTNKNPKDNSSVSYNVSKDSSFDYELELAYTQNLPLNYNVYELQKLETNETASDSVTVEGIDSEGQVITLGTFKKSLLSKKGDTETITIKNNKEMYGEQFVSENGTSDTIVNLGRYDIYDTGANNDSLNLVTNFDANGNISFDLDYYLIELKWKENIKFSNYLKETDLVYVIVKAMQLEPIETTATTETTTTENASTAETVTSEASTES